MTKIIPMDMEEGNYEFDLIAGIGIEPDDLKTLIIRMVSHKQIFPDKHGMNLINTYTVDFQRGALTFRCIIPKDKPIPEIESEIRSFFFGKSRTPYFTVKKALFLKKVRQGEHLRIDWDRIDREEIG